MATTTCGRCWRGEAMREVIGWAPRSPPNEHRPRLPREHFREDVSLQAVLFGRGGTRPSTSLVNATGVREIRGSFDSGYLVIILCHRSLNTELILGIQKPVPGGVEWEKSLSNPSVSKSLRINSKVNNSPTRLTARCEHHVVRRNESPFRFCDITYRIRSREPENTARNYSCSLFTAEKQFSVATRRLFVPGQKDRSAVDIAASCAVVRVLAARRADLVTRRAGDNVARHELIAFAADSYQARIRTRKVVHYREYRPFTMRRAISPEHKCLVAPKQKARNRHAGFQSCRIWTALNIEVLRVDEGDRGEYGTAPECKGGETGDPLENPPTSGIVRHDSHVRKSGIDHAGNRTRFT
ncbi:hypothetical protein PR048_023370 [Dryococelus australis]|uniref:Uncharacterized protein n=1 Tax=Dryococelus australis TaxID=614101 RepID=A0ABQ9GTY6_9NEOP|nr:hypothetical protein PR048_023370 [Dryococelus australis]